MALTDTERAQAATDDTPPAIEEPSRRLVGDRCGSRCCCCSSSAGSSWRDPSLSAPTRDPAWYTWRANVILQSNPVIGRAGVGARRGCSPAATGSRCRSRERCCSACRGLDQYSFSAFLMIGVPVLTGLALGAGAFRSRRDPLAMLMTMLVVGGAVPHHAVRRLPGQHHGPVPAGADVPVPARGADLVGSADRVVPDRDRGGVHAPDDVRDLRRRAAGVFGFHFLTSRFSFGSALRADGPMLMSVGFGMIAGLAMWVVGIWGKSASLADAALPPPVHEGVLRGAPRRVGDVAAAADRRAARDHVAIVSTILIARRERTSGAHVRPGRRSGGCCRCSGRSRCSPRPSSRTTGS